ncbi:MAG TPA: thioredoxin-dependent thiol peroxidase [Candidatus Saccharimonadales bacterium]|nr:thioredoxin-dependent thiol peroxidase [Candidatus Saccharimonadales bacterium]
MMLQVGQKAPEFALPDEDNTMHTLSEYKGKWVLLYFYPKDDTPGCTTEACSMRDNLPHFNDIKAVVLGVSVDSVESHKKFAQKYTLPFTLLADTGKTVVNQYGVWQSKTIFGKEVGGTKRTSFLIDPKGNIAKIYLNVNPLTHTKEVLKDFEDIS